MPFYLAWLFLLSLGMEKDEQKELTVDENEVLQAVKERFLDEPIELDFNFEPKNRIEKLLMFLGIKKRSKKIIINGVNLGTLLKISAALLRINYDEKPEPGEGVLDWSYKVIVNNGDLAVQVIAMAIHNQRTDHPIELEHLILDNYESRDLKKTVFRILSKMNVEDFTITITSIRKMMILKEVSPQPAETIAPENIIHGDQLATIGSIFETAVKI